MENKQKRLTWNKGKVFNRIIITCEICGKEKSVTGARTKTRASRFCSTVCRNYFFAQMPKHKKCIVCGSSFKDRRNGKRKYCSSKCYWERLKQMHGSKDDRDYLSIQINGKKIRAHRHLMQEHLGRKLSKTEIVHHINGDKQDNRIDNLEIVTRSEHAKKHFNKIISDLRKQ